MDRRQLERARIDERNRAMAQLIRAKTPSPHVDRPIRGGPQDNPSGFETRR